MDGAIRKCGDVYTLPAKVKFSEKIMVEWPIAEPEESEEKPVIDTGPTRKELMAQLDAAGIKYKPVGNKAYFQGLLDEAKPPGCSEVPSKEFEVID